MGTNDNTNEMFPIIQRGINRSAYCTLFFCDVKQECKTMYDVNTNKIYMGRNEQPIINKTNSLIKNTGKSNNVKTKGFLFSEATSPTFFCVM